MRRLILVILALMIIGIPYSQAQRFQWERNNEFLNRGIDQELASEHASINASCLCDLNGDGRPEYIICDNPARLSRLTLAVMEGEFPNIHWRSRNGFFGNFEYEFWILSITAFDLNEDGNLELILASSDGNQFVVLTNQGDFENPRWVRNDDLFPVHFGEPNSCTPQFCDFDQDGNLDLILGYDNGYFRYEKNENGEWIAQGFTEVQQVGWIITFHLADLDRDGDLDILCTCDMPCEWTTSMVVRNGGTPAEPEWQEPELMEYYNHCNPIPYDLNNDGFIDIIDGWRYQLHAGGEDLAQWSSPVIWGNMRLGESAYVFHYDRDGILEVISGFGYGSYNEPHWRLAQYRQTPSGWEDCQFLGADFEEFSPDHTWLKNIYAKYYPHLGSLCLVTSAYNDSWTPRSRLTLWQLVKEQEETTARPVEGFFSALENEEYAHQVITLGDLNNNVDPDVLLLQGDSQEQMFLSFFEFGMNGNEPSFARRDDWRIAAFDTCNFRSVELADFDHDRDPDLIGLRARGNAPGE
ncbi:MAG: VCBS repeat-containing protein, partial [Calditrichota bacterium]